MALVPRGQGEVDLLYQVFAQHHPATVSLEMLEQSGWSSNRAMEAANVLLRQRKIKVLKTPDNQPLFEYIPPEIAKRFQSVDHNAMKVYSHIEKRGDKGASTKDLKGATQMQDRQITQICRELKTKKLIKEVKTMSGLRTFMLIDVEPDPRLCGGVFHDQGALDKAWIEELRSCCREVLESAPSGKGVKLEDFHDRILHKGNQGGKTTRKEEVESLLRTLVLDGEFLMSTDEGEKTYVLNGKSGGIGFDFFGGRFPAGRDLNPMQLQHDSIERGRFVVPCLACPLVDECAPGGRVCPEKCEYITRWLHGEATAGAPSW